jgi:hypothetical protein
MPATLPKKPPLLNILCSTIKSRQIDNINANFKKENTVIIRMCQDCITLHYAFSAPRNIAQEDQQKVPHADP